MGDDVSTDGVRHVGTGYYTNVESDFESTITILLTALNKSRCVRASLVILKKVLRCVNTS